ncbi:Immunoglobulin a1 protease [Thalictrum thalictroides]|uniref:Immunoglobulin a1 protease n=1 Tax=Thalictrum thalictroides TaxID=46969 RepID=A0A7J6V895_THATH|nr:Immunoglobulin a1 protease [Thalictrum thalictroides]
MSAIVVCGNSNNNKRSFFEDLPTNNTTTSPPSSSSSSSKRLRCLSRFSPPRSTTNHFNPFAYSSLVYHLTTLFPSMDNQLLEKALEECGNDLDSAIKRLTELRLSSGDGDSEPGIAQQPLQTGVAPNAGDVAPSDNLSTPDNLPKDGSEWVELLVREMANASNMDDAKARATRVLEFLETSIRTRAGAKASENFQMENVVLKEQIEALIRENTILKRAVAIQHERQKEYDEQSQELQHLKQLVSQYQEQLRTLEVNNYALTVHLKQAQQSSSIPGRFHPDVF